MTIKISNTACFTMKSHDLVIYMILSKLRLPHKMMHVTYDGNSYTRFCTAIFINFILNTCVKMKS